MKPPKRYQRTFSSYEAAAEAAREQDVEEYYEEEETEEDPMDEFDRLYDEWQDEQAASGTEE